MKICVAVDNDKGLGSAVAAHFGSAQFFLLVDAETLAYKTFPNESRRVEALCRSVAALGGEKADGLIVGGIGVLALTRLFEAGCKVYKSRRSTAGESIEAFKNGKLPLVSADNVCIGGRRGQGRACGTDCG